MLHSTQPLKFEEEKKNHLVSTNEIPWCIKTWWVAGVKRP
jgi:hypothetical protein